uniref:ACB domain-containing protein n=1 Tax=Heligmosomoides polygyrus TaxID=6339 RepID=A0A183FXG1_HELPZ
LDDKHWSAIGRDLSGCSRRSGPVTATTDEKLAFYSLYKQATIGPCNTPRPSFWNLVEKEAWSDLGAMDSNEAKAAYVQRLLKKISEVNKEYDVAVSSVLNFQTEQASSSFESVSGTGNASHFHGVSQGPLEGIFRAHAEQIIASYFQE